MKKILAALVLVSTLGGVAIAQAINGEAQVNIPTTGGTVTLYRVNQNWDLYIGNGQPPVWHGTQDEFQRWTRAACGAANAFAP